MNLRDSSNKKQKEGYGLIDYIVNKLPEIHIPGYQYCGPGTKLEKRLARGDPGINKLDQACKVHDIAYTTLRNSKDRRQADRALVAQALPRVYAQDAKLGERAAALLVSSLMGTKIGLSKIGLGLDKKLKKKMKVSKHHRHHVTKVGKKKRKNKKMLNRKKHKSISFGKLVSGVRANIKKKSKTSSLSDTIKAAVRSAKDLKRNKTVKIPRVLKLPKFGGSILPILPILSALSAIGSISASAIGVAKAIRNIKNAKENMNGESEKKIGRSLYLTQDYSGSGFYLKPFQHHSK